MMRKFYFKKLADIDSIELPICHGSLNDHAWHLFPIILKPNAKLTRNEFIDQMAMLGIGTSVHYKPIHQLTYYKERYGLRANDYPNTELTWQGTVSLPLYPYMEETDMEYVSEMVHRLLK